MKEFVKFLIKKLPIALTKNQRYDRQTELIISKVCEKDSCCIDVGCHKGEVLDVMLQYAPKGTHFGFEPIPEMYAALCEKYDDNCQFFEVALSDSEGETTFNHVISNPAYSGIQKRIYDRPEEQDTTITVKKNALDNLIPEDQDIRLIKIDVEGGELGVLRGAKNLVSRCKPVIVFEHGLGAADVYGTKPEEIFDLLSGEYGMQVSLMKSWLIKKPALDRAEMVRQFSTGENHYFIAHFES
jgi:FkbM family methyltransferase